MLHLGRRGGRRRKTFYYFLIVPVGFATVFYIYLTMLLPNLVTFLSELDEPLPSVVTQSQQAATFLETHPVLGIALLVGGALMPAILRVLFVSLLVMLRRRIH